MPDTFSSGDCKIENFEKLEGESKHYFRSETGIQGSVPPNTNFTPEGHRSRCACTSHLDSALVQMAVKGAVTPVPTSMGMPDLFSSGQCRN